MADCQESKVRNLLVYLAFYLFSSSEGFFAMFSRRIFVQDSHCSFGSLNIGATVGEFYLMLPVCLLRVDAASFLYNVVVDFVEL